jgi:hypothetical protein
MTKLTVILSLLLTFFAAQSAPKFEDYKVAVYSGAMHWPKWIRHVGNDEWRDELDKLVEPPEINFAGKYFVAVHSCGTGCRYYTMTDLSSGREIKLLKNFGAADLLTRANSKLLVAQYHVNSSRGEECRERAFLFDGKLITPLTNTRRTCTRKA